MEETKEYLNITGLIFFYREIGPYFASFLNKRFKRFNPNNLTVLGLIIHLLVLFIFALHGTPGINIYSLILVFGIQVATILDYMDGYYARLTNQVTDFGGWLDRLVDSIRLFSTFAVLFCLINSKALVFLLLVYAFKTQLVSDATNDVGNNKIKNKKVNFRFIRNLLGIFIGFTKAHVHLFICIWILFNNNYVLFTLIIISSCTLLKYFKKPKKLTEGYNKTSLD